jgi:predicted  nucleic acid-binding Zn-ribbon protein
VPQKERYGATETLRKKYAPKIVTLQEKIRKAQQAVERETAQTSQAKMQTAVSVEATLLGVFMGRKAMSTSPIGRASTAIGRAGRSMEQAGDIGRAQETVAEYQRQLDDLNAQFQEETNALEAKIDPASEQFEPVPIKPKKTDIVVQLVSLVWAPYRADVQGRIEPAW